MRRHQFITTPGHHPFFIRDGVEDNHLGRIDLFVLLDLIGAENPTFVSLQAPTRGWFGRLARIERQLADLGLFQKQRRRRPMFTDPRRRTAHNAQVDDDHIHFMRRGEY